MLWRTSGEEIGCDTPKDILALRRTTLYETELHIIPLKLGFSFFRAFSRVGIRLAESEIEQGDLARPDPTRET